MLKLALSSPHRARLLASGSRSPFVEVFKARALAPIRVPFKMDRAPDTATDPFAPSS